MRQVMFLAQDGVVLCTTLRALDELGILVPSLEADRSLAELYRDLTNVGFGALRVGAQCLASSGWLRDVPTIEPETTILGWTVAGRFAMGSRDHYVALGELLAQFASTANDTWTRPWTPDQIDQFLELVQAASDRWRLDPRMPSDLAALIRAHLDGALIVPAMLWLHQTNRLGEEGPKLPQDGSGEGMKQLLEALGWITAADGNWASGGRQARAFALNFGGVATYLPLLARLPELYRGELTVGSGGEASSSEWHVHRELNLSISAAAHGRYFADADPIFIELFNREPIDAQPGFIAEMGCGNGSWLIHLSHLIKDRTRRGEQLESLPLTLIGIDPDRTALDQARRNLDSAGVPALLIPGDVTDPDQLRNTLEEHGEHGFAIEDGLHIRAFVDHERTFLGADPATQVPGWSSGVYIDGDGRPLSGEEVERDLVAHLRRWEEARPQARDDRLGGPLRFAAGRTQTSRLTAQRRLRCPPSLFGTIPSRSPGIRPLRSGGGTSADEHFRAPLSEPAAIRLDQPQPAASHGYRAAAARD